MRKNIEIEREYQRMYTRLKHEFESIDKNDDNKLTLNELIQFLNVKTKGTVDTNQAEEIFAGLDLDQQGTVTLDEFVTSYFDQ